MGDPCDGLSGQVHPLIVSPPVCGISPQMSQCFTAHQATTTSPLCSQTSPPEPLQFLKPVILMFFSGVILGCECLHAVLLQPCFPLWW